MSEAIAQFAQDVSDAAHTVAAINTDGVTGAFGTSLADQKHAFAVTLEQLSDALHQLQASADEHRRSEVTFLATAPTMADLGHAEEELNTLQEAGPTGSGTFTAANVLPDVVYMQAVEKAQQRFIQLSQERRAAVRIFLDEQNRVAGKINATPIPKEPSPGFLPNSETRPAAPAETPVTPGVSSHPGVGLPGGAQSNGSGPADSSSTASPPASHSGASSGDTGHVPVGDALAAGTPVAAMGAAPMMVPQVGMINPAAMSARFVPQVLPGSALPGTTTSGGQITPMSDRDFNSLLDRLKPDRSAIHSGVPTSTAGFGSGSAGSGAGGGSSPAAAPRLVQPASWVNASTSPTGVSEGQNSRSAGASAPQSSTANARPSGMPPMGPMAPMGGHGGGGGPRDSKDQPHIKNEDPDVYGDDVKTTDPIIDNKGGRFV